MTAYATLLRRLARAMSVLDWPGARTPSAAAGEAAELLLQLDAKDFPTEELGHQYRLLCAELAEFARSSESRSSDLLGEHDELAVFCESLKQLLAKCLAEVRIKSDVASALCPSCKTSRETDVLATWVHRWEYFKDSNMWWIDVYRILECRCTKIFSQYERIENVGESPPIVLDDGPAFYEFGFPDLVSTVTNYDWIPVRVSAPQRSSKASKRPRPAWMARIQDEPLRSLLDEVYAAADSDHRVLTAIGVRTVVDRGMQLLGTGSTAGFAQRLNALVGKGLISCEERGWLQKTTEAGSAAAHRGWRPNREEIEAMLDAMEHFLQRFDLKARTERIDYPARPRPHASSMRNAPTREADGVSKDADARVVDLRSAKRIVTDEPK